MTKTTTTENATTTKTFRPYINRVKVHFTIAGTTSLVVHAWSEKAKKEIRDKQAKKAAAQKGKEARDPAAEYETAKYRAGEGPCAHTPFATGKDLMPALAIKHAMVGASRTIDDLKMTFLRQVFFIRGIESEEWLPLEYERCSMREDPVRIGEGKSDMRYRPEYHGWKTSFELEFNANAMSLEQIRNLLALAGYSVGLLEWRPEKDGNHGRFEIIDEVVVP